MEKAVLRPVLGRMDIRDPKVVLSAYLKRVRHRWLDLATEYSDPYLPANPLVRARFQGLLDCRPPFAYVMPGGHRPCNTPSLCPSCWARDAVGAWSGLDRGLYGDSPKRMVRLEGVTLVVRTMVYWLWRVPVRPDGELVDPDDYVPLAGFLDRRIAQAGRSFYSWAGDAGGEGSMARRPSEFRAFRRRGVVCGLETTRIGSRALPGDEIAASRNEGGMPWREWCVAFTTILLVPTGCVDRVVCPPFRSAPGVGAGRTAVPPGKVEVVSCGPATPRARRRLRAGVPLPGPDDPLGRPRHGNRVPGGPLGPPPPGLVRRPGRPGRSDGRDAPGLSRCRGRRGPRSGMRIARRARVDRVGLRGRGPVNAAAGPRRIPR
jgi:hypothetical protein